MVICSGVLTQQADVTARPLQKPKLQCNGRSLLRPEDGGVRTDAVLQDEEEEDDELFDVEPDDDVDDVVSKQPVPW